MNRSNVAGGWLVWLVATLAIAACGDSGTSSSGDAGTDTAADTGADTAAETGADQGGDTTTDTGVDQPVEDVDPGMCTIDSSGASFANDVLAIESVDFVSDVVVIRNVGNSAVNFDDTWRISVNGPTDTSLGAARDLPAGGRMRIHLTQSGVNDDDDTFVPAVTRDLFDCGGEVTILNNTGGTGWSNHPEYVRAFVAWGRRLSDNTGSTATYSDEANSADLWSETGSAANVMTCYDAPRDADWCRAPAQVNCETADIGIIATDDGNAPEGWTRVETEADHGCLR